MLRRSQHRSVLIKVEVVKVVGGVVCVSRAMELVVMPLAAGHHIVQWLGEQRQAQMMLSLNPTSNLHISDPRCSE